MVKNSKLIIFCICTVVSGLFIHSIYTEGTNGFSELFGLVYGYVDFQEYGSMAITLIKWILPQLLLILFWGDYIESSLMEHLDYILTRTNNMGKYLFMVYSKLFCFVLLACIILYTMTAVVAASGANQMDLSPDMIKDMFLYCVYLFLMLVLVNTLSIFMRAVSSAFVVIGAQIAMFGVTKLIVDGTVSEEIYGILPTSTVLFYYRGNYPEVGGLLSLLLLVMLLFGVFALNVVVLKKKEVL